MVVHMGATIVCAIDIITLLPLTIETEPTLVNSFRKIGLCCPSVLPKTSGEHPHFLATGCEVGIVPLTFGIGLDH